ncbi:MAG: response regulator [Candidatus Uhrbacteria bacterium]
MRRVLVIDDEPAICDIVAMALDAGGQFATETGTTGAELYAMLDAHDDVAAIICDNQLVGETGLEIHAKIKSSLRARKIAFFLLHGSGADLRERVGERYFGEQEIVEIHKPMHSILALTAIVDAEVTRLRS